MSSQGSNPILWPILASARAQIPMETTPKINVLEVIVGGMEGGISLTISTRVAVVMEVPGAVFLLSLCGRRELCIFSQLAIGMVDGRTGDESDVGCGQFGNGCGS